jgi:UDP-4-amino-4,6-dideoxy-L-N-acetyl-beta-L-altrosamine transaminase
MTNFLPYAHQSIDGSDIAAVTEALLQPIITRGAQVEAFEQQVCAYVGARHAVAFSSGSAALYAAFQAGQVGPNDHIVSTPNTFIATVAGGVRSGATLSLVDIDAYGNMDVQAAAPRLCQQRSRGKTVVVPVHFAGVAVDMHALDDQMSVPSTLVIEDAAHALGSKYPDGSPVGNCQYSDMTIFSFHAIKNITCGEGGMVTTNDPALDARLRTIRDSGIERTTLRNHPTPEPWYYEVPELSSNYHMTEGQAALGVSQLRRIEEFAQKKAALVAAYRERLSSMPAVRLPPAEADSRSHRHLFCIFIDFDAVAQTRTEVMEGLQGLGIGSQYHYVPLYNHPALKAALGAPGAFPAMESHFHTALSIPFYSGLNEADVDRVVMALRKVLYRL